MKKITFSIIFLALTMNISAQIFLGTISNSGSILQFKIKPSGGDITSAIGYFEFSIRYRSTNNLTFSNLTANIANTNPATGFPGLSITESSDRTLGGYTYKRFIATVTIPSQTYRNNTEYKVFEVKLSGSGIDNPLEIQLATNYESSVPNDYYFVVSDGAGNPLVDVSGINNFYPNQSQNLSDRYFSLMNIALPVELLSFQAQNTKNGNLLTWQTASEVNSSHFDIERSLNGTIFQKIDEVKAQGKAANYQYLDKTPLSGTTYYRLKTHDVDDKTDYSKIISVSLNSGSKVKIYPNPAQNSLTIDLGDIKQATIQLTDVLGRVVLQKEGQSDQVIFDMSNLESGVYLTEVKAKGVLIQEKVIKN